MIYILEAIEKKQIIKFKYNNESGFRLAEVYIMGVNHIGTGLIRAYEVGEGWKLFNMAKMSEITVTDKKYMGYRTGYNPFDKAFKKILKKVA